MSARRRWAFGLTWLALLLAQVSECVNITEASDLAVIVAEHNTNSTAILDCEYDLDAKPDELKFLTVKWYFNNLSSGVYQWLKEMPPSASGVLKGRLNLDYVASPDPLMRHRALSIINPTIELGGKYICTVSTNLGVSSQSKKMVVYAPVRTMNLTEEKPSPTTVNISCLVEGVYPAPKLQLFATPEGNKDSRKLLEDVSTWQQVTDDSLFDAMVNATVEDASLEGTTEFECVMSVPETPYVERRSITYSSGAVLAASKEKGAASRSVVLSPGLQGVSLLLLAASRHR